MEYLGRGGNVLGYNAMYNPSGLYPENISSFGGRWALGFLKSKLTMMIPQTPLLGTGDWEDLRGCWRQLAGFLPCDPEANATLPQRWYKRTQKHFRLAFSGCLVPQFLGQSSRTHIHRPPPLSPSSHPLREASGKWGPRLGGSATSFLTSARLGRSPHSLSLSRAGGCEFF